MSGDEHIEIEAEKEIVKQAFNKAMDSLSAKQRAVLSVRMHMRPTQDGGERPQFTHDVIGKQLGISAEAVRQREKLGFKNDMAIPKIEKISINMGVGEASQDKGKIDGAVNDLKLISGQQPVITSARKSVAGFKLREGG